MYKSKTTSGHDKNYTSFNASSLKWGGGERGAYSRGGAYFKFRPIGGVVIRRGHSFEGGEGR